MDDVITAQTPTTGRPRQRGAEERIRQLIRRHKAEQEALEVQAEYMRRVAVMLIPLVPKQTVSRILAAAKEPSQPTTHNQPKRSNFNVGFQAHQPPHN